MFRRFVGLFISDNTPDHSTLWRFHKLLGEKLLAEPLFNEVFDQLEQQNNTRKSQVRNTVERVFGHFKLHYGMTKARHLGLMQFHINTVFTCVVHNLKTAVSIKLNYGITA